MGFFKNLFKGRFKKIFNNAKKNIASGQLIKGGGFLGDVINKATSPYTAAVGSVLGGHKPIPSPARPDGNPTVSQPTFGTSSKKVPQPKDGNVQSSTIAGIPIMTIIIGTLVFLLLKRK